MVVIVSDQMVRPMMMASNMKTLKMMLITMAALCLVLVVYLKNERSDVFNKLMEPNPPPTPAIIDIGVQPGDTFTRVSIKAVYDRFEPKTLPSCENKCTDRDPLCNTKAVDKPTWDAVVGTKKDLKVKSLFSVKEYIFPWEKEYLRDPRLTDLKTLSDVERTRIDFLGVLDTQKNIVVSVKNARALVGNSSTDGHRKFRGQIRADVGQRLVFRVGLVDGLGDRRPHGGDAIRAWLSSPRVSGNAMDRKGNSAAGEVKDMGNGTYEVRVTPVWEGVAKLNIALVYPREYIRMALNHSRMGTHRFILGLFKKGSTQEATICHPSPNIPGRPCLCNFTDFNGVPFFCGRPLHPMLSCQHWQATWPSFGVPYKDFTRAEATLADDMARPLTKALIPNTISILASGNGAWEDNLPSCPNGKNYSITWTAEAPRGYWSHGRIWKSLVCKEPPITSDHALRCLANHRILIIGDSNGVRLKGGVQKLIPGKTTRSGSWPFRNDHINRQYNITISFRPHEYPLYLQHRWMPVLTYGGVGEEIGRISSTEKYVLIVHYYYHISTSHLSALFTRLNKLKRSLADLIQRNPNGLIAVRGPHIATVAWEENHMFAGDILGNFMVQMYNEVFYELRDRVVYLDGWEMSLAIENQGVHPSDVLPQAMIRTLVALKCSR